jgi:hypothetical protein
MTNDEKYHFIDSLLTDVRTAVTETMRLMEARLKLLNMELAMYGESSPVWELTGCKELTLDLRDVMGNVEDYLNDAVHPAREALQAALEAVPSNKEENYR